LDIFLTQRSGEDLWLIPDFQETKFNCPIIETNCHGKLLTKADFRIFPSKSVVDFYNIKIAHQIIPNAIMPKITTNDLREKLGIPKNAFVLGKISRPALEIFNDITYKAYKLIENDNTYFIQMAATNQTIQKVEELKLKNFRALPESLDDLFISEFYNTLDILCHSNALGETFGNTIAEAMIHNKAVVTHISNSFWPQAQKELLCQSSENVASEDFYNYAEKIFNLMNDKNLLYSQKINNGLFAQKEYHYLNVAKQYEILFLKYLYNI
jgi:glycosyltransferase involved in cell wall biosynthesis